MKASFEFGAFLYNKLYCAVYSLRCSTRWIVVFFGDERFCIWSAHLYELLQYIFSPALNFITNNSSFFLPSHEVSGNGVSECVQICRLFNSTHFFVQTAYTTNCLFVFQYVLPIPDISICAYWCQLLIITDNYEAQITMIKKFKENHAYTGWPCTIRC